MYDHAATLKTIVHTANTYGDLIETVSTSNDVFCRIESANNKDKIAAQATGKTAEMAIILADMAEYNDQIKLTVNSTDYEVVTTYWRDNSRELRLVVRKWQTK